MMGIEMDSMVKRRKQRLIDPDESSTMDSVD